VDEPEIVGVHRSFSSEGQPTDSSTLIHCIDQRYERSLVFERGEPWIEDKPGFLIEDANLNVQTGASQFCSTTPAALRGINNRDHDTSNAGLDQGLAAGWRTAVVVAWL
jgi:hypothetical protein